MKKTLFTRLQQSMTYHTVVSRRRCDWLSSPHLLILFDYQCYIHITTAFLVYLPSFSTDIYNTSGDTGRRAGSTTQHGIKPQLYTAPRELSSLSPSSRILLLLTGGGRLLP